MGLPVVATEAAWTGTGFMPGEGIVAADDAGEFARHVIRLLREPDYRSAMAAAARAAVERDYSWDQQLAALDAVIAEVCSGE